jgi:hypothetical protein
MAPMGECLRKMGMLRDWAIDGGVGWLEKGEIPVFSG